MINQRTHPHTLIAVGLFILLAFALRAHHLDHFSFWIDEAITSVRASQNVGDIIGGRTFIQEAVSYDTHTPFYYLLVYITRQLWGDSDYAYRYLSLLFGVLLVPLLFQLGKELFDRQVGIVVALLVAINPLFIWYSQEARMYTLLVWLGALSTYLLVRGLSSQQTKMWRWLCLYLLVSGLMVYTHYTAVFLLFAHILFWLWHLWQLGYHKLIFSGLVAITLALIPLLHLTVPRLFTGAETGYAYLSPRIIFADIIGGFSMGITPPEATGSALWWAYLLLLGWGIWLGSQQAKTNRITVFLLLSYLFVTVIGISIVSYLKPMYLGVRHIIVGSPAFLLFISVGLTKSSFHASYLRRGVLLLGWIVLFWGSGASVWNLYTNPTAKDNIRAMVAYVEEQALEGDLILYHDAILMLVHQHYAQRTDLTVTALPVYPQLADENTITQLEELILLHERVWFLPAPPIDGRDPDKFVVSWIAENLYLIDQYSLTAYGTLLKVEVYRTSRTVVNTLPTPFRILELGTTPTLQGYIPTAHTRHNLWFDIFWQGDEPNLHERLLFSLIGVDGRTWAEGSSLLWLGSPSWAEDVSSYIHTSYRLPLTRGLPAGTYELQVQGWDDIRQVPLGKIETLASVNIFPTRGDTNRPQIGLWAGDNLTLAEVNPYDKVVKPGHILPVRLLWVGNENGNGSLPADIRYTVQLISSKGDIIWEKRGQPGASWLSEWPSYAWVGELLAVSIPATAEVGDYQLRWQVQEGEQHVAIRPWWKPAWLAQEWATLGTLTIEPWPFLAEKDVPAVSHPVQAQFDQFATLLGYDLTQTADQLDLTLYWRTEQRPPANYFVFVHLLDPSTGQPVRQQDWFPANGIRPTEGWRPSEIILDPHTLDLTGLPAGDYRLTVGLYDPEDFTRPVVTLGGAEQPDRQLLLQELTIE